MLAYVLQPAHAEPGVRANTHRLLSGHKASTKTSCEGDITFRERYRVILRMLYRASDRQRALLTAMP